MNETQTSPASSVTDREMLVEVLDYYIYRLRQDNCNQAAIDAHVALQRRLEDGQSIDVQPGLYDQEAELPAGMTPEKAQANYEKALAHLATIR